MKKLLVIVALSSFGVAIPASASFPSSFSTSGTDANGKTISATANFSLSGNNLIVTLNNTSPVFQSNLEVLFGVEFTTDGGKTITGETTTSAAGKEICTFGGTCSDGGAVTSANRTSSDSSWSNTTVSGRPATDFYLTTLPGAGNDWGIVNNAMNGIASPGNSLAGDSPYFKGPVTFTLTLSSSGTLPTTVSAAKFFFGTGGVPINGTPTVPEPGFYGLLSLALTGLVFARRRTPNAKDTV